MAELSAVACGYGLVEGPRVDDQDNLYFSDVLNGGVYRRSADGAVETMIPKRRGVGGIAPHAAGGLVVSGRNICHVRDGQTRILFAPKAPGLNDLFADSIGRVICGTIRSDPFGAELDRTPGECWRIDGEGRAIVLYADVVLTNGIGLSPDGSVLYHSDTASHAGPRLGRGRLGQRPKVPGSTRRPGAGWPGRRRSRNRVGRRCLGVRLGSCLLAWW